MTKTILDWDKVKTIKDVRLIMKAVNPRILVSQPNGEVGKTLAHLCTTYEIEEPPKTKWWEW